MRGVPTTAEKSCKSGRKDSRSASADGQRFLLNVSIDESSVLPITVVQNWTADFKKDVSRR